MSVLRNAARRLFGKSFEIINLEIKFHTEANLYGCHGVLRASNATLGIQNKSIRFVFRGLCESPALTPTVLDYIWNEAKAQGWTPHHLESYGSVLETHSGISLSELVTQSQYRNEEKERHQISHDVPAVTRSLARQDIESGIEQRQHVNNLQSAEISGELLSFMQKAHATSQAFKGTEASTVYTPSVVPKPSQQQ